MAYDQRFKEQFIIELIEAGYPDNEYAMQEVLKRHNKPTRITALRWWHEYRDRQNPHLSKNVQELKTDIADRLDDLAHKLIDRALDGNTVDGLREREVFTALGITLDKLRIWRDLPTHIIQGLPDLIIALEEIGEDPQDVFRRMVAVSRIRKEELADVDRQ